MQKNRKKEILSIFKTMEKAHLAIEKVIGQRKADLTEILSELQNSAFEAGTELEKEIGEDHEIILLLEAYCEFAWQLNQAKNRQDKKQALKSMKQSLREVTAKVKEEIEEKIVAVFLPYKASMWDSLESVWKAADRDENCEAYVIPIPYYDRTPNGELGQMHDESDQYPEDVPITKYDRYDFEQKRPDLIFIHNPYDDANRVTSVHPYFYAQNLKKYTSMLVYIPYFVWGELSGENQAEVNAMQHFCTTPGVIHADRVIVQSEAMRSIYIDVLTQAAGEHTREIWEKKVLGLGSPKLDKTRSAMSGGEMTELPQEWKSVLYDENGNKKRTVLYNTTIKTLLETQGQMIEKMQDVFAYFKERQDTIAFIWRPHPLIPATIKSMHPKLWERYKKLMDSYRKEGWGIYDDTPDVNTAICISDIYYGDGSTVINLYQKTGKPVILQNTAVRNQEKNGCRPPEDSPVFTEDCVEIDGSLFFAARDFNCICSLDLKNGNLSLIDSFPQGSIFDYRLGAKTVAAGSRLIFPPMRAQKIWSYDIEQKKWEGTERKQLTNGETAGEMFQAVEYSGKLFLIGCNYPAIICRDLQTQKTVYIEEPYCEWKKKGMQMADSYFRSDCAQKGNYLYLAACIDNLVLEFDMETYAYRWIEVGSAQNRYSGIAYDGKDFWLAPRCRTPIVKWDGENEWKEYPLPEEILESKGRFAFLGAIYAHGQVIFPGMEQPNTIVVNPCEDPQLTVVSGQYTFCKPYKDGLSIRQNTEGRIEILDADGVKQSFSCTIGVEEMRNYLMQERFLCETTFKTPVPESLMINRLIAAGNRELIVKSAEKEAEVNPCGEKIWEAMRSLDLAF